MPTWLTTTLELTAATILSVGIRSLSGKKDVKSPDLIYCHLITNSPQEDSTIRAPLMITHSENTQVLDARDMMMSRPGPTVTNYHSHSSVEGRTHYTCTQRFMIPLPFPLQHSQESPLVQPGNISDDPTMSAMWSFTDQDKHARIFKFIRLI